MGMTGRRVALLAFAVLIQASPGLADLHSISIDPFAGWNGYFHWTNGPGSLDGIQTSEYRQDIYGHHLDPFTIGPGDWEWSITLPADGVMTFIKSKDPYNPPGDKWALRVDGALVPWTNVYTTTGAGGLSGYFHGDHSDLALLAGTHTFTLDITEVCYTSVPTGAGSIQFSPMAAMVPVPGAVLLGAIGLGVAGWRLKRRTV
jgi:hypothetical protein